MKYIKSILLISVALFAISCANKTEEKTTEKNAVTIPVRTETIVKTTFNHFIEVTGVVEPEQYAFISPESPGQIKKILVSEGQTVSKGQVLIKLNTAVIDGKIQQVESQLDLAKITYEKQDELWNNKHVGSEIQFLKAKAQKEGLESQLEALKSQKDMAIIEAPFSGIIDKINLKEGELASPGMQLIQLVNLDKMKIKSEVSEQLLPVIHKGDSVLISFPTYKDIEITAPIYRTGNIINPANRTFTVEVKIKNIDKKLKPFMISTLKIKDYTLKQAITVPSIIVKKDFDKSFVFISEKTDSNTVAKKVFVETGRSYKDRTVISKGLKINDKIIIQGYNTVSNGAAINSIK